MCKDKIEIAKQNLERYQLMTKIKLEFLRYFTSLGGKTQ
jgi:hypothetical protein